MIPWTRLILGHIRSARVPRSVEQEVADLGMIELCLLQSDRLRESVELRNCVFIYWV